MTALVTAAEIRFADSPTEAPEVDLAVRALWHRQFSDAVEGSKSHDIRLSHVAAGPLLVTHLGWVCIEINRFNSRLGVGTRAARVMPTFVFELGYEGIQPSTRHKSGIAVRFPRMLRIRDDKPLHEADTLATLQRLIAGT